MTKMVYKSAQGKLIDMGKLILQNEHVRAVGNMGVNARGDQLDDNNQITAPKQQQLKRNYDRQIKR